MAGRGGAGRGEGLVTELPGGPCWMPLLGGWSRVNEVPVTARCAQLQGTRPWGIFRDSIQGTSEGVPAGEQCERRAWSLRLAGWEGGKRGGAQRGMGAASARAGGLAWKGADRAGEREEPRTSPEDTRVRGRRTAGGKAGRECDQRARSGLRPGARERRQTLQGPLFG